MPYAYALAAPDPADTTTPESDYDVYLPRNLVLEYYDVVADHERTVRPTGATPYADDRREHVQETYDATESCTATAPAEPVFDLYPDAMLAHGENTPYPDRRLPIWDAPPVFGTDVALLADVFEQCLAECRRRPATERDWPTLFATRWLPMPAFAREHDLGVAVIHRSS